MRDDALTVIVCGASAALDLPGYLVRLRQRVQAPLRVLLTHSAERFLRAEALAWHADEAYGPGDPLNPTELARRSRGLAVLPATANLLACAALGLAGTPAQTALLAHPRPALLFPSMNAVMWEKPTTRRHVAALRAEGHVVVDPQPGEVYELWRGQVVDGRGLVTPERAAQVVASWWQTLGAPGAAPAEEPSDGH
ncbi:flavoprotein [Kitasatospora sp. CM 4170]|uniref:Flavoprotein n=1 Tax=Kitasatospora aburaviensis TaxID=67265 RepID=A0ABW1F4M8_9ACTN|nr:flavoprotein [Kitasatospora sp. CM 4170]WNM49847.1 flavoprotein [Kitasatospora sp. CM 4170]